MLHPVDEAPKAHGIPRTFKISSKETATLKIPKILANVPIMYWCEFKSLIYNDLNQEQKQSRSATAMQSFDKYKTAFDPVFNRCRLKPDVQTYAKKMHKYTKKEGIFDLYQIEFDTLKKEMLQQQYETMKRNSKLDKNIILEELLQKGLRSVRNEPSNQGEGSKSGSSSSNQTSEAKSLGLINAQHVFYQNALKLHQLSTEKKKLSPQQKKNE